jgi:hypothetical protein
MSVEPKESLPELMEKLRNAEKEQQLAKARVKVVVKEVRLVLASEDTNDYERDNVMYGLDVAHELATQAYELVKTIREKINAYFMDNSHVLRLAA